MGDRELPTDGWLCQTCGKIELYEFKRGHWEPGAMRVDMCGENPVQVLITSAVVVVGLEPLSASIDADGRVTMAARAVLRDQRVSSTDG